MQVMLILIDERDRKWTEEARAQAFSSMGQWIGELASQGKVRGGAPLQPEDAGFRVTAAETRDGPFTETKEVIGGYFVIEVSSMDEARRIAGTCPHAQFGTVEVREIIEMG